MKSIKQDNSNYMYQLNKTFFKKEVINCVINLSLWRTLYTNTFIKEEKSIDANTANFLNFWFAQLL